jgi:tetratricopeptide (TPR) repeat protein
MLTDNEIKRITKDALGFKVFAKTLEEIVCSSETPITIGVYGEWGSGKTSLMRMTQDLLKRKSTIKTVWFNAWKFDKSHDLQVALIHTILRKMKEDKNAADTFKEKVGDLIEKVNWLGLGKTTLSLFLPLTTTMQESAPLLKNPEDIPKTLELIGDFEDEFKTITTEYVDDGRLVVFVDDLDRCIPEKTLDVMEAIKTFLNVQQSVFIIGADKQVIQHGIIQRYGKKSEEWAKHYLDKIIQVSITPPPLMKGINIEQFIKKLNIADEIKEYTPIIAEAGDNPRTIKRLLNQFEIQRILATNRELKVESGIMIKLAVIKFRWPGFYTDLISVYSETKTNLVTVLKEINDTAEREKKLQEWNTLREYSDDNQLLTFLLEEPPFIAEIDLDQYVYAIKRTTEVKRSEVTYFNIAHSFYVNKDYMNAIKNYDKALELNPEYGNAWVERGAALATLKRQEDALQCCDKALELNPNDKKALYLRDHLLEQDGQTDETQKCTQKVKN